MTFRSTRAFALSTALGIAAVTLGSSLMAQTIYSEQGKLIRASEAITALGPDLFGDQVNLYTGSLEFMQTDVSLPGNNALPVRVGRRFIPHRGGLIGVLTAPQLGMFEDWDLDIPHIHGIFHSPNTTSSGWKSPINDDQLCTNYGPPPPAADSTGVAIFDEGEFWHGNFLYAPGAGDQEILIRDLQNTLAPTNAAPYPLVTKANWAIKCIPTLVTGAGEGFLAVANSPDERSDSGVSFAKKTKTLRSQYFVAFFDPDS